VYFGGIDPPCWNADEVTFNDILASVRNHPT
jgi:hypothetical protein